MVQNNPSTTNQTNNNKWLYKISPKKFLIIFLIISFILAFIIGGIILGMNKSEKQLSLTKKSDRVKIVAIEFN
jgi:hypothetical protein